MKNLFEPKVKEEILSRIAKLQPGTKAFLGKNECEPGFTPHEHDL